MNRAALVVIAVVATLTGCSRTKKIESPMKPLAAGLSMAAPADKARVVIARPFRGAAFRMTYHVIDNDNRYVGDTFNDSAFAIDLEPGVHKLCAGKGPSVNATLAAGKTYLVRIDLTFTSVRAVPVKPGTDDFKELMASMGEIRGAELITPFTEDALKPDEVKEQATDCADSDKDMSSEDRAAQSLAAADSI